MSLNQIINPVKPLDVIFGNITADNLEGSETTILDDVAGGDFIAGDNVDSTSITKGQVFIRDIGDLLDTGVRYKQKKYILLEGSATTPAILVVGKEGLLEFTLQDPSITTEWLAVNKGLVVGMGAVNDGVNDLVGSLFLDVSSVSAGSIICKFISVYGSLKPSTEYKIAFEITFATEVA